MPREIKPGYEYAVVEKVTAPLYLCELQLWQQTLRVCSFDDIVSAMNNQWVDANLVISGPEQRYGGMLTATVSIPFDVQDVLQLVTQKRPQDRPAKIYMTYWHEDTYLEPMLLLDGLIDDVSLFSGRGSKPRVSFTVVTKGNRGGQTPFIRLGPPTLKYLTPAGSVVAWNGGSYRIGE